MVVGGIVTSDNALVLHNVYIKITIVVKLVFWHHRVHYSDNFHSSTVFIQIKHMIHINSENLVNLTLRKPPLIIDFGLIQFSTIPDEASWLSQSVYFMATNYGCLLLICFPLQCFCTMDLISDIGV